MWEEELREEELLMAPPEQLFTRCVQAPLFDSMPFFFSPLARPLVREPCSAQKASPYDAFLANPFFYGTHIVPPANNNDT